MTTTAPPTETTGTCEHLADALAACPPIAEPSSQRQDLMMAIWSTVCTRTQRVVVPMGSSAPVTITPDDASTELIAVMDWLHLHEKEARHLGPDQLYRMMRAVATLGMNGSGRAARADQLRGVTDVPKGTPLRWAELDDERTVR
jgi:hypothetical protein